LLKKIYPRINLFAKILLLNTIKPFSGHEHRSLRLRRKPLQGGYLKDPFLSIQILSKAAWQTWRGNDPHHLLVNFRRKLYSIYISWNSLNNFLPTTNDFNPFNQFGAVQTARIHIHTAKFMNKRFLYAVIVVKSTHHSYFFFSFAC
jgi:hypothetical protein